MDCKWKISEISCDGEVITHAKYHVIASEDEFQVETKGNWYFDAPKLKIPFKDVTEDMLVSWIENDAMNNGASIIKSRLQEQINQLSKRKVAVPPWLPQKFKIKEQ